MKPSYLKLIDNNSDHWIEATLKNYLIHLFQKHKQKLDFDTVINYLQTDLDLQIRDKTLLNSIWFEIDSSEYNSNQSEATEKWNEVILRDIYDSFEREVIANLEIGNHRQFWKEYQLHVFYPIAKKAFYKYANRSSISQNLEIYNKSISDEFKKIIVKHSNIDAISSFIKKFTSKEKISLSYFLLFIKYFYIVEFLKGNVKLEDQADIDNYLRDYLDIQIFYFFEVFNTSVKLESYFSKSTESLSSILIDDNLKKNFDNEKRLRETLDSIIKIHTTKIEDFYTSNEIKINELLNAIQVEKETVLNISNEIQKSQNEFKKQFSEYFQSMLGNAQNTIETYLFKHKEYAAELLRINRDDYKKQELLNNEISERQKYVENKVSEIEKYEKRIQRNLKTQVEQFTKKDLEKKQKEINNSRKSYRARKTKLRGEEESNDKKIPYIILGFILSLIFGSCAFYFLLVSLSNEFSWLCGSISSLLVWYSIWSLSTYINTKKSLKRRHDSLLEDSSELKKRNDDVREIERNFIRDTNNTINNIFIDQVNGAQFGDNNEMDNNTQSFRDTSPPFKVTDFSKG